MFKYQKPTFHTTLWNQEIRRFFTTSAAPILYDSKTSTFRFSLSPDSKKISLSKLVNCDNLRQIRQVHAKLTINGMVNDLIVANKLMHAYINHSSLVDGCKVFDRMSERETGSWSVIIGGFAKARDYKNCLRMFRECIRSGIGLDSYILPLVIRACREKVNVIIGRMVHTVVFKSGFLLDPFVCAASVDMYAKCGFLDDARRLFDGMVSRDLLTWTVMIKACAGCGNANESLVLFDQMREEGLVADNFVMVTVANACAILGAMHKAKLVLDYVKDRHFCVDGVLGTAMIDMFAKCGSIDTAREIFDAMPEKNVISWCAMIAAYGYHGQGQKALELFLMMLRSGISPNAPTFVSLLNACCHSGFVEEGLQFFSSMQKEYFIRPNVKHYTCMVDLLGRAGRLDQALQLIESMTADKDCGLWRALLRACQFHGHAELAQKAAEHLLELQPHNYSHYVLLSNIYAKSGKQAELSKIKELMVTRKLRKVSGWTCIEADDKSHKFGFGDHTHPRSKEIHEKLKSLGKKLELAGYIPDTNLLLHDVDEKFKLEMLYMHSEKLAIAFGLIGTTDGTPIRITQNNGVCGDCHTFCKFVSAVEHRGIILRDANRFHHFMEGSCSCGDYY